MNLRLFTKILPDPFFEILRSLTRLSAAEKQPMLARTCLREAVEEWVPGLYDLRQSGD